MRRWPLGVVLVGVALVGCSEVGDADGGAGAGNADAGDSGTGTGGGPAGGGGGSPGAGGSGTGGSSASGGSGGAASGGTGTGGTSCTPDDPASGDYGSGATGSGTAAADVADIDECDAVADWSDTDRAREEAILTAVNENRAAGTDCAAAKSPVGALTMDPVLRCAARKHAKDMADRDYFSHNTRNNCADECSGECSGGLDCAELGGTSRCLEGPGHRLDDVDYNGNTWGENIAAGSSTAAGTMTQWMSSNGHCSNIMGNGFSKIGVGYAAGGRYGHVWVQVFGD